MKQKEKKIEKTYRFISKQVLHYEIIPQYSIIKSPARSQTSNSVLSLGATKK